MYKQEHRGRLVNFLPALGALEDEDLLYADESAAEVTKQRVGVALHPVPALAENAVRAVGVRVERLVREGGRVVAGHVGSDPGPVRGSPIALIVFVGIGH